jgi:hypothetical protein
MKVISILLIWFSLSVFCFAVSGAQQFHGIGIPVNTSQIITWTERGPVPAGRFFISRNFEWGNPMTWGDNMVLSQIVMRLSDFVLLSLPGFFAWLALELVPEEIDKL